ncbi:P-loop containing nucleoside triphosphate hydrolase protein [Pavlovales sp. CCMP2436]|nr:P-loop containing nucleoside triphosphate hydrolase protein [Pavlovales sp. CCMP2436]
MEKKDDPTLSDAEWAAAKAAKKAKKAAKRKAADGEAPSSKKAKLEAELVPASSDKLAEKKVAGAKGGGGGGDGCTPVAAAAYWEEHRIAISGDEVSQFRPSLTFGEVGFDPEVLRATETFKDPTPIQATCWPIAMAGRDVIGIAETGSGKTLGFFLPALMHIRRKPAPNGQRPIRVLVLSPTRELAMQTECLIMTAGAHCGISSLCVYGGVPKFPQIKALRAGVDVVVATPGRLLDLVVNDRAAELGAADFVVLDEADRLLDLGFEKDVRSIVSATAPIAVRQTAMFTATWPDSVRTLAEDFLTRPVTVTVGSTELTANHRVQQIVEVIEPERKDSRLLQMLKQYHSSRTNRVLVFALYKKEAARVEVALQRAGYNCCAIHGDQSQPQRTAALGDFKSGKCPLLIATDVAARGLDIPDVEVVINFTFPLTIEDYIHRIGRTGRAGKSGISHTLFTLHDKACAGALQNVLREASQPVPDELLKFGSTVKKKEHKLYGAFGPKDGEVAKAPTKITFDD